MLEKTIENYFARRVKELGGRSYKFKSPSHRGVSDRIVALPNGVVWFVEIKRPGGKVSPLQEVFARDMQALGQRYACVWSIKDVDEWIKNAS